MEEEKMDYYRDYYHLDILERRCYVCRCRVFGKKYDALDRTVDLYLKLGQF